ncbi:TRAP transporter small permease [Microvirga vignae]|uniref:TRAP transporter small permease n=1 Tax=Microvirga vignae TaxID=1225564 RepID=UPI00069B3715|nr:TRAP transporter small permease [Microvirga vignae]
METQSEIVEVSENPTWLERIGEIIIVPLMLAIIAIGFVAVVLRFAFGGQYALFWSEELIRYAFVWMFWLCAPILVWRGTMFTVDLFINILPDVAQAILRVLISLGIIGLLGTYTYYGWMMAKLNSPQLSSALGISLFWIYLAIPVGSSLIILAVVVQLLQWARGRK